MKKKNLFKSVFELLRFSSGLCPKYVFYTVLSTITSTAKRLLYILIPGLLANILDTSASLSYPLVIVTIFCITVTVADAIERFFSIQRTSLGYALNNRGTLKIGQKGMRIDFKYWDNAAYMEDNLRAVRGSWIYMGVCDSFFENLLSSLIAIAAISYILYRVDLLVLLALFALVTISVILDRKGTRIQHDLTEAEVPADKKKRYDENAVLDLQYGKELRAFGAADYMKKKYEASSREVSKYEKKKSASAASFSVFNQILLFAESLLVYITSIFKYADGRINLSYLLVYYGAVIQLKEAVNSIFDFFTDLAEIKDYYDDIDGFMSAKEALRTGKAKIGKGFELEFRNVYFKYAQAEKDTLKSVSFRISGNEKLCIVGENGSGKTTLVKLLLRLYDPTSGEILLNGRNIKEYDYESYLSLMSPVFQDFQLHAYSIKENISFDKPCDTQRLDELLSEYRLLEPVHSLRHGLDTMVTKLLDADGVEFSGGEKQKLAMVRAAYKDATLFILDEPTSNIDPVAEADFYEKVKGLF